MGVLGVERKMSITDQRGSIVIERTECLRLLARGANERKLGRLGICLDGIPHIIPVNFSVVDRRIIVRLGSGLLSSHADGTRVAFEVDHAEAFSNNGWSVLVHGLAQLLSDEEVAHVGRNLPQPMVMHPGTQVFSIRLDALTGRVVNHDHLISEAFPPTSTPHAWAPDCEP